MAGYKSHSVEEVRKAQRAGQDIYALDTGNAGHDDTVIAAVEETRESVLSEILAFHELEELPEDWSLDLVDWEI